MLKTGNIHDGLAEDIFPAKDDGNKGPKLGVGAFAELAFEMRVPHPHGKVAEALMDLALPVA